MNKAAIEAARKKEKEQQRLQEAAAAEEARVQREQERIERERLEAIRVAEEEERKRQVIAAEIARIQREKDQRIERERLEAIRVAEEEERRKKAAAAEIARMQREKERVALTPEIMDEYENVFYHYTLTLKYEKITINAKAALFAKELAKAMQFESDRNAMEYVPPGGVMVVELFDQLLVLKRNLLVREQFHCKDDNAMAIDYADICRDYLGRIQKLLGSRVDAANLKIIPWADLKPVQGPSKLGNGANGIVYKMEWQNQNVAVKIVTSSECVFKHKEYDSELLRSSQEAERVVEINKRGEIGISDVCIQVYGFVEGQVPSLLSSSLKGVAPEEDAFGIVMRLEAGGSLHRLLHAEAGKPQMPLLLREQVRLLSRFARGLFELHKIGVIHGDIKPSNVLLTDKTVPEVRIADFGTSFVHDKGAMESRLGTSSIQRTNVIRGTPLYSAPEMFDSMAKASRSTDVFAFGITMHEILSRTIPYENLRLHPKQFQDSVCNDVRPDLALLPSDTPPSLVILIQKCWDGNRAVRPTAADCLATITHAHSVLDSKEFDIFFSYSSKKKSFINHLFEMLTGLGYRIWLDQNNMGHNMPASMQTGITQSTVTMAFVDPDYQQSANCMFELEHARQSKKPVSVVVTEGNIWNWGTDAFKSACDIKTKMYTDLGEVANQPGWTDPDAIDGLVESLVGAVEQKGLLKILQDLGCHPSMPLFAPTSPRTANVISGGPKTNSIRSLLPRRLGGKPNPSTVYVASLVNDVPVNEPIVPKNPTAALTRALFVEYTFLERHCQLNIQYETLTQQAGEALDRYSEEITEGIFLKELRQLDEQLREGCKIECNFNGRGLYYPGHISRTRSDGLYDIIYDDGDKETGVSSDLIRAMSGSVNERSSTDVLFAENVQRLGAQRAALRYTPPDDLSIASGKIRLVGLRSKLRSRSANIIDNLHEPYYIEYAVTCEIYSSKIQRLLDLEFSTPAEVAAVSGLSKCNGWLPSDLTVLLLFLRFSLSRMGSQWLARPTQRLR